MEQWLVIGLITEIPWPSIMTEITFKGHILKLNPPNKSILPCLMFKFSPPRLDEESALSLCREFLSSLAWAYQSKVYEVDVTYGSEPLLVTKPIEAPASVNGFDSSHIQEVYDEKSKLALALYREALGLNSKPYQFFNFYKIININHKEDSSLMTWINQNIGKVANQKMMQKLLKNINNRRETIGKYLYLDCRCAIAHVFQRPLINPESIEDLEKLRLSLPVIKLLAEYFIEEELGVGLGTSLKNNTQADQSSITI